MSVICIGGCCIPYSVLWPFLLLIFKPLYDWLAKKLGWEKPKECTKCNSSSNENVPCKQDEKPQQLHEGVFHIEKDADFNNIKKSDSVSFAKFTAKWCKPCQKIKPHYHDLAKEHGHIASFMTVDVDDCDSLAAEHGAIRIPLFVAYQSGKKLGSINTDEPHKLKEFVTQKVGNSNNEQKLD